MSKSVTCVSTKPMNSDFMFSCADSGVVGKIKVAKGVLEFEGNAEASAEEFLKFLKQRCLSEWSDLQQKLNALAAENAALKAGPHGFFAYGGECGYEEFKTAEEAREFADEEIASYREQACDGWSDEVRGVVWGIVMQRATMTGLRPVEEGDNCAEGFTEWCDYTLLPNVETPVTDASLNATRAEGVIMFASNQLSAAGDLDSTITMERLMLDAEEFAGQLRAGKDGE